MLNFLRDFLHFLRREKKWWIIPLLVLVVLVVLILGLSAGSGISWALYPSR
jgi:polyferredoxin